jgi:hypothetical protein
MILPDKSRLKDFDTNQSFLVGGILSETLSRSKNCRLLLQEHEIKWLHRSLACGATANTFLLILWNVPVVYAQSYWYSLIYWLAMFGTIAATSALLTWFVMKTDGQFKGDNR